MDHLESIIRKDLNEKLPELLALHGVSGREYEVEAYVKKELEPLVDEINVDPLGNVIGHLKGKGTKKLMIAAHMDEIGLMIKHIDERGFLFFETIGGVRAQNLYARECEILTAEGKVPGIINSIRPGRPYGDEQISSANDFFIDIGANNRDEIEKMGIEVGQPVALVYRFKKLKDKIVGTALDNRLLMFILIEVLKELKHQDRDPIPDLYPVFTVQEEVGCRGAKVAAHTIDPDLAIALDITMANDLPKVHTSEYIAELGKGPAIKVMDNIRRIGLGHIVSSRMVDQLKSAAKSNDLPYQLEVQAAGSTDGATIHLEGKGTPTGAICLPSRYVHAYEMAAIDDVINTAKLLYKTIEALNVDG